MGLGATPHNAAARPVEIVTHRKKEVMGTGRRSAHPNGRLLHLVKCLNPAIEQGSNRQVIFL